MANETEKSATVPVVPPPVDQANTSDPANGPDGCTSPTAKKTIQDPPKFNASDRHNLTGEDVRKLGRLIPDNPTQTFKDSVPFKDIIKNEQLCQNLANMGYTRATASQAATIERYEKLGEVSNMKITAPFNSGKTLSYSLPMVLQIIRKKDDLQTKVWSNSKIVAAFGAPEIAQGKNALGRTCYAMIICHSHDLAIQTYSELCDLVKDLDITVLLCRKGENNSPVGNLADIRAGNGHIVVATIGRVKTLSTSEMSRVFTHPVIAKGIQNGDHRFRNDLVTSSNVFSTVSHLIIDETNFIFDTSRDDDSQKTEDLQAIRQLTTLFGEDWKIFMIRAVSLERLARLPFSAKEDSFDVSIYEQVTEEDPPEVGDDQPGHSDGGDEWGADTSLYPTVAKDWYAMTGKKGFDLGWTDVETENDFTDFVPQLILRKLRDDFPASAKSTFENSYYNDMCDLVMKNIFYKDDGTPGKTVVVVQHRKSADQLQMFLGGAPKFVNSGHYPAGLSSDRDQNTRDWAMSVFRDSQSRLSVLIATSALVRGMNFKADRFILAEIPSVGPDPSDEKRALAMDDFLTCINRGSRNTTSNDVVVIFSPRDHVLAHMLRFYADFVATCQQTPNNYGSTIKNFFPEGGDAQQKKEKWASKEETGGHYQ